MNDRFEYINTLQCRIKSLKFQVKEFKSGEKYLSIKADYKAQLNDKDSEIKRLKLELADANKQIVTNRKHLQQVVEDLDKEHKKALREKDRELKKTEDRALRAEQRSDKYKDEILEQKREIYRILTLLEDEQGKNLKLRAQLNRDYENSSIPSSMAKPSRKKITNNRESTGKKPGGQPGHKGHGRQKQQPTNKVFIPAPYEYLNNPNYRLTGKIITKQLINLSISVDVLECSTPELRNKETGTRVHAAFPPGMVNDVNYGGSVKAFAFLLNNHCCVSIDKVRDFLSELTDGKLQISKGMINGLSREFSLKTQKEQREIFSNLQHSPVMGIDFSGARLNGKNVQISVCAGPAGVIYQARENKGHKGVKGTPVEDYQGILIHDHDLTFYSYGSAHQECLTHILRYLLDSIENEPALTWNKQMRELIREMIHYRNSLVEDDKLDPERVAEYENRYIEILETAKIEYEFVSPSKYYMDGYNLYSRLFKFKDSHLLFLHDERVPTNNNLCERLLRIFKRKQKQIMTFRSFESLEYLCVSLGMINLLRLHNQNLYRSTASIFD